MKFIKIKTKDELNLFLDKIWNFHDSVISKITYLSGSTGDKTASCPFDSKRKLIVRFESVRVDEDWVDGLELKFDKLERIFIAPIEEDYTTNIMFADIKIINGKFVFANDKITDEFTFDCKEKFVYFIVSQNLSYRFFNKKEEL